MAASGVRITETKSVNDFAHERPRQTRQMGSYVTVAQYAYSFRRRCTPTQMRCDEERQYLFVSHCGS